MSTTSAPPDVDRIRALTPLLAAIAREIEERSAALEALLVRRSQCSARDPERTSLEAECAAHRRELRHARKELERLHCGIVSTHPCVFCVAVGEGRNLGLVYWEAGAWSAHSSLDP
jgi:hypothetical protein